MATGSNFGIFMAIYGQKIIVDSFPFAIHLDSHGHHFKTFAQIFAALKKACNSLQTYYMNPDNQIEEHQRQYPYINSFSNSQFTYEMQLFPGSLMYIVKSSTYPQNLLVKFTRNYGAVAHRACARLGIAPNLIHFEV